MWRKHLSTFQDSIKYIQNDIVNPFRVVILKYAERVRKIHDLAKYLSPTLMRGGDYYQSCWNVCGKELSEYNIHIATKYRQPTSIQDELEDKTKD